MKKQTTIKDIAEKLGVSISTVSRALQDHEDISIKTREAVKELASLLGYKPNRVALNLKHNRTGTIGLILPEIQHHFFSKILSGIESIAYENNYNVMVFQSNESYLKEIINTQTLIQNRVDGVLVSYSKETRDFTHFQQLIDNEIPLVFFDRIIENVHADVVMIDDYAGAYDAVSHLIEQGCQRIAYYSAPLHLGISQKRMQGYKDALEHHEIGFDKNLVYSCDCYEDAIGISRSVLKKHDRPDGIFAVNDLTAIGAMKVAKQLDINIPKELKIIGFENSKTAVIYEPELTSVDQFGFELGKEATKLLLKRIPLNSFDYQPERIVLKAKLIIRGSG